jgi:hypothetical protein
MRYLALVMLLSSVAFGQGWTQLTNTALQASGTNTVCPPNHFQAGVNGMPDYNFTANCVTITGAWSGAAADTKRNRLIIMGGGHSAYAGNEVYSLDLVNLSIDV